MAQHRCGEYDCASAIGNGAANRLVGDSGAQLGGSGFKQLIACHNLPIAKACNADSGNQDEDQRENVGASVRVGANGAGIWRHLAHLHNKWVHELHDAETSDATAHRRLSTESAHIGLAHTNLFHQARLLIDECGDLCR